MDTLKSNKTLPYQGNLKGPDWYAQEQERYLREKLGKELFEYLERKMDKKDFVLEAVTKVYHGCEVTAFRTENTEEYYHFIPWRFSIKYNSVRHDYVGMPNYVETKAKALKRGWYRAKWLNDGTYHKRYLT